MCPAGIEVTDFQTPDKMSDTVNYLPDILKIHWTLCQRVWVLDFKRPQFVDLPAKMFYDNF